MSVLQNVATAEQFLPELSPGRHMAQQSRRFGQNSVVRLVQRGIRATRLSHSFSLLITLCGNACAGGSNEQSERQRGKPFDVDSSLEIQKAIRTAFRADATLDGLVAKRIYDAVPKEVVFPYVAFGPLLGEPFDGVALDGWECLVELHVWSRKRGRVQCQQIMSALVDLLHDQTLPLDTATMINARLTSQRTFLDPDGVTSRGVLRFRYVTQT